jgi:hypothetical protein
LKLPAFTHDMQLGIDCRQAQLEADRRVFEQSQLLDYTA